MLLFDTSGGGDTMTVTALLSVADGQSLMNYQDEYGNTLLHITVHVGWTHQSDWAPSLTAPLLRPKW